jgi:hypothetical protein
VKQKIRSLSRIGRGEKCSNFMLLMVANMVMAERKVKSAILGLPEFAVLLSGVQTYQGR